jgi:hypothetical protein
MAMFDERPAYFFGNGGRQAMVYADHGRAQKTFPPNITLRIASTWTNQPAASATKDQLTDADQWTVAGSFRPLRPLANESISRASVPPVPVSISETIQILFPHLNRYHLHARITGQSFADLDVVCSRTRELFGLQRKPNRSLLMRRERDALKSVE